MDHFWLFRNFGFLFGELLVERLDLRLQILWVLLRWILTITFFVVFKLLFKVCNQLFLFALIFKHPLHHFKSLLSSVLDLVHLDLKYCYISFELGFNLEHLDYMALSFVSNLSGLGQLLIQISNLILKRCDIIWLSIHLGYFSSIFLHNFVLRLIQFDLK